MSGDQTTHFGFQEVPLDDKARRVRGVFDSVADRYDLMNDLMSLGVHRLWKRFAIEKAGLRPGHRVLDLAGGTGDLAALMAPKVAPEGSVVLSDINEAMLGVGRRRLEDRGIVGNVAYALVNAEALPFEDAGFDAVTIAFGLRNVTDKDAALREMHRVLKPGGRAMILEFSKVEFEGLKKIYDVYSFGILPRLGKLVADDEASYRYLAESIRMHPDQETLKDMMSDAGFVDCEFHNMTGGIVALHKGIKP